MRNFLELIKDCLTDVREIMPWDMAARVAANPDLLIIDVREPYEFDAMHIEGSINVPRGILESACEWDYEETVPELVEAREREIVVVCRSGNRSTLAWAVAKSEDGTSREELDRCVSQAGFDLGPVSHLLRD